MNLLKNFILLVTLISCLQGPSLMASESAYPKAEVDEIEIYTLPPARLLEAGAGTEGNYFNNSNGLFSKLFNYIKTNDISMTVPVEGELEQSGMRFYLGSDAPLQLDQTSEVSVLALPERQVLRIGGKGSYSEENVMNALNKLKSWVDKQSDWQINGSIYAVFWDAPFTPWFLKRFEVHIPVSLVPSKLSSKN